MGQLSDEGRITEVRRHLHDGMNATRAHQVRALLRAHPGQLGPNPDQLVAALVGVIVVVSVAVALLGIFGA
jgi:hypothetical protein